MKNRKERQDRATLPIMTKYNFDDRLLKRSYADGIELDPYAYDTDNRLKTVNGPWADDTVSYDFNELNNLKVLKVLRDDSSVAYENDFFYDYNLSDPGIIKLGRLSNIQAGAGTFVYGYSGVNSPVQSLTRLNGSVTLYQYNDPLMPGFRLWAGTVTT